MSDFTKCNKISGIYFSTDNIEDFKFQVKLKEINKTIPILKFESPIEDLEHLIETEDVGYSEERIFKWQEKISRASLDQDDASNDGSKDESDSIRDENIKKNVNNKIISYINEDEFNNEENPSTNVNKISDKMKNIYIGLKNNNCDNNGSELMMEDYLKNNNIAPSIECCIKMYIVVDMNDYERDPTLVLNREHVLFTLLWNPIQKCLTVSPDFNDLQFNPYSLEINYDSKQTFHYSIEQITNEIDDAKLTEIDISNKISKFKDDIRMRKMFQTFPLPPKHILKCLVIFEILFAESFENDNLYVEYTIDIPYGFETKDSLKGVTQISSVKNKKKTANFGHVFEICINYHMNYGENDFLTATPQIFFEIISCDVWGRHRTEGYCWSYIPLTQPGYTVKSLNAIRPQASNKRLWEMKRFFVGGCHILKDITSIGTPSTYQGDCLMKSGMTCVTTGKLKVATRVILHNQSLAKDHTSLEHHKNAVERLNVDSLFSSVNTVLLAYKSAKAKLQACLNDVEN